jgi:hypothetical protein
MSVVHHTRWAIHPAMGIVGFVTLLYPFLLNRFHATVGVDGSGGLSPMSIAVAALWQYQRRYLQRRRSRMARSVDSTIFRE